MGPRAFPRQLVKSWQQFDLVTIVSCPAKNTLYCRFRLQNSKFSRLRQLRKRQVRIELSYFSHSLLQHL